MSIYDYIKEKEGFRDQAYDDAVGVKTIGYGRTGGSFEPTTREAEDAWLKRRVDSDRNYVENYAKDHGYNWSDQQKDALSSFVFNLGRGRLDQLTGGGKRSDETIGQKIRLYNKAGGNTLPGLVTRRNEESAMFSGNPGGVPQSTFQSPHTDGPSAQPIPPRVLDEPTFDEAFAQARQAQGAGGEFEWQGNFYNTNYKEEDMQGLYDGTPMVQHLRRGSTAVLDEEEIKRREAARLAGAGNTSKGRNEGRSEIFVDPLEDITTASQAGYKSLPTAADALAGADYRGNQSIQHPDASPRSQPVVVPEMREPVVHPDASPQGQQTGVMNATQKEAHWRQVWNASGGRDANAKAAYEAARQERMALEASFGGGGDPRTGMTPGSLTDTSLASEVSGRPDVDVGALPQGSTDSGNNAPVDEFGNVIVDSNWQAALDSIEALEELGDMEGAQAIRDTLPDNLRNAQPGTTTTKLPYDKTYGEIHPDVQTKVYDNQAKEIEKRKAEAETFADYEAAQAAEVELKEKQRQHESRIDEEKLLDLRDGEAKLQDDLAKAQREADRAQGTQFEEQANQSVKDAEAAVKKNQKEQADIIQKNTVVSDARDEAKVPKLGEEAEPEVLDLPDSRDEAKDPTKTTEDLGDGASSSTTDNGNTIVDDGKGNKSIFSADQVAKVESVIKDFLGLEGADVKRAIGMYLLSRATGASHQGSMQWAGQQVYDRAAKRETAETKHITDLIDGGKYTSESIAAYKKSGDPADLIAAGGGLKELGNSKTFYSPGGGSVQAREVEDANGNKHWVTNDNKPVNLNTHHEDPKRVKGTAEYTTHRNTQIGIVEKDLAALQEKFDTFSTKEGDKNFTDIVSRTEARKVVDWALKANIPPEGMGQLMENAYQQAINESKGGKKARSLTAYLNQQYVETQIGDTSLFSDSAGKAVSAEKVGPLIDQIANRAGLTGSRINNSTKIIQTYRPQWNALTDAQRKDYNKRTIGGESGFMKFLRDKLEGDVAT